MAHWNKLQAFVGLLGISQQVGAQIATFAAHNESACVGATDSDCMNDCIWTHGVTTQECELQCDDLRCSGFVWRPENGGKCKFYGGSAVLSPQPFEGRMCFIRESSPIPGHKHRHAAFMPHNESECVGAADSDCLIGCAWTQGVTTEDCESLCDDLGCSGFVWRAENGGKCKFYGGRAILSPHPFEGRMCFIKESSAVPEHNHPDAIFTAHDESECVGAADSDCMNDCTWTQGVTTEACESMCYYLQCSGFVWRPADGGKCKFYGDRAVLSAQPSEGRVCFIMEDNSVLDHTGQVDVVEEADAISV